LGRGGVAGGAADADALAGGEAGPDLNLGEGVLLPVIGELAEGLQQLVDQVVVVLGGAPGRPVTGLCGRPAAILRTA